MQIGGIANDGTREPQQAREVKSCNTLPLKSIYMLGGQRAPSNSPVKLGMRKPVSAGLFLQLTSLYP